MADCCSFLTLRRCTAGALGEVLTGDEQQDKEEVLMDMLLAIADEKHILYGSDYPYVPAPVLLKKKRPWIWLWPRKDSWSKCI